ncbi:hypothetical protein FPOA_13340 [Fusarium poae]|uniref:MULE transposase domain-containing protein n=2 Tax=Fusarium poae TaxID=36050 RepID=A0A1B8A618_FUSPO|nr:hypothetical protein FPOA_13340 [Fusarium poae]
MDSYDLFCTTFSASFPPSQNERHFFPSPEPEWYPEPVGEGGLSEEERKWLEAATIETIDPMLDESFPADALPPEDQYESREAAREAINSWAKSRGYAFVTGRSGKTPNGRTWVHFTCDRGAGRITTMKEEDRKRRTGARRTGCQFSVMAKESLDGANWAVRHREGPQYASHNHPRSRGDGRAHPEHRKLSEEELIEIRRLIRRGIMPRQITNLMRDSSRQTVIKQKDLYNAIARSKQQLMEGQSCMQALAQQLQDRGFWSRIQRDDDTGRVKAVFFAHPRSIQYLKTYPEVLIMDCTYRSNRYKMPLLDIIGVDCCGKSFCIAFAFLTGEAEHDYAWALMWLRHIFNLHQIDLPSVIVTDRSLACMNALASSDCFPDIPALLCVWHIDRAVKAYCSPAFLRDHDNLQRHEDWGAFYAAFREVMYAPTQTIYYEKLDDFKEKYALDHSREVGYILEAWITPYKHKFIKAWTNQYRHYGQTATSRVEGIHQLIKNEIDSASVDLFEAWMKMTLVIETQCDQLDQMQTDEHSRPPADLVGGIWSVVRTWISSQALREVNKQVKLLQKEVSPCTGIFTKTLGLPCSHTIRALIRLRKPLQLHHFARHYQIRRPEIPLVILEPAKQFDRLAAKSSQAESSIRREPSRFEVVEKELQGRAPPKCTGCGQEGHKRNSKMCPSRHDYLKESSSQLPSVPEVVPSVEPTVQQPVPQSPGQTVVYTTTRTTTTQVEQRTIQISSPSSTGSPPIPPPSPPPRQVTPLMHDDGRVIYSRYKAAREEWYREQPPHRQTDKLYRKAKGLRARYNKAEKAYVLSDSRMGRHVKRRNGLKLRDWTDEEIAAYLDWDKEEEERAYEKEAAKPLYDRNRNLNSYWEEAAVDFQSREALYNQSNAPD